MLSIKHGQVSFLQKPHFKMVNVDFTESQDDNGGLSGTSGWLAHPRLSLPDTATDAGFIFFYFCIWLLSHLLVNNKAGLKRDSPTVREAIAAINLIKTIDRVKQQSVECRAPWCIHPLYSLRDMLIRGWVFTRCVSLPTCIHRLKMAHLWHIGPDDNLKRTRFVAKKPRLQKPFPAGCRPALSDREWRAHQA